MFYKFIFSLVAISLLIFLTVRLLEMEKQKNEIIKVQITLENKCEFFDKVFGKDTVKYATDCKEKLKTDAMGHFETQANQKFINDMTEHLIDNTKFSLPGTFLKKWMQTAGKNPITTEEAEAEYAKSERGLRYQLIESKIMQEHNFMAF